MAKLATTKMSSKGQVVIPENIRRALRLRTGVRFVVTGGNGIVVLKVINPPSPAEFDALVAEARRQAKKAGMKRSDVAAAVAAVRSGRWK